MGFFAKLFGSKADTEVEAAAHEAADAAAHASTAVEEAAAAVKDEAMHVADEANEHVGYASDAAKETVQNVAEGTPAEEMVDDALDADKQ